jgi:hypothetical protein
MASAGANGDDVVEGWRRRVLESLAPKTKAYYREGRPQVDGDRLVLLFRYPFHYKQALENKEEVEARVRSHLGTGLDLRLAETTPETATAPTAPHTSARPLAPEEDPVIKAAERKLEAKVVRVRPLKETS